MENTRRPRKPVSAEAIARLADQGEDVSRFFTNSGRVIGPIMRVNADLADGIRGETEAAARLVSGGRNLGAVGLAYSEYQT